MSSKSIVRAKVRANPRKRIIWLPYFMVAPVAIYLAVFMAYPMVRGFLLSFTETSLFRPNDNAFVGFDNYAELIQDTSTWNAVSVTLLYCLGSLTGALFLGFAAALVMNMPMRRGRGLVRSLTMLPWAAPPIAVALIFIWMFNNQYGVVNFFLERSGLSADGPNWLDNPNLALVALLVMTIWMTFPISALILLAALQSIPAELYEASRVDGAGVFNRFRYVTIPAMRPTLYILMLFLTIWALRRFDIIWVMTQGGPVGKTSTLVVELYRQAFMNQNLGFASAIGVIGLMLSGIATAIYYWVNQRDEREGDAR